MKKNTTDLKKVSIIGVGYVGQPLANSLADNFHTVAYDENEKLITMLKSHKKLNDRITLTNNIIEIQNSDYYIVTVPTPVTADNNPDYSFLIKATNDVSSYIQKKSVIIFESTVAPGTIEKLCIPLLEKNTNLICGKDFFVGYSPERINPGDKEHTIQNTKKLVAGFDKKSLKLVSNLYKTFLGNRVVQVESIKIAEAAKIVENIQRDTNIALMNEIQQIFYKTGIDIRKVLEAANTKWNFVDVSPGLVGGHCIAVDPYYLLDYSVSRGIYPELISISRKVNESKKKNIIDLLSRYASQYSRNVKIGVFGISYKKNIPDTRNSKSIEICLELLKNEKFSLSIFDPVVPKDSCIKLIEQHRRNHSEPYLLDIILICVNHDKFKCWETFVNKNTVVVDITGENEEVFSSLCHYIYF